MKNTILTLLAISLLTLVSCSKSKTYTAVESATQTAIAALDTVTSPVSVAQVVALCSSSCNDAALLYGEMKGDEIEKARELHDLLHVKATAKSDSLTRIILDDMVIHEEIPAEPGS